MIDTGEGPAPKDEFDFELEDGTKVVAAGEFVLDKTPLNAKPVITIPHPTDNVALMLSGLQIDKDALMAAIVGLPAEDVPGVVDHFGALKSTFEFLTKTGEARLDKEWNAITAETKGLWTAPDGTQREYVGAGRNEVSDPEGLKAALEAIYNEVKPPPGGLRDPHEVSMIEECFETKLEAKLTPLASLEKIEKYGAAIRDFRVWRSGPKHLKVIEEKKPTKRVKK